MSIIKFINTFAKIGNDRLDAHNELRQHAKEMGLENELTSFIDQQKPRERKERPTEAEIKHRQKRKIKKKIAEKNKRKNR